VDQDRKEDGVDAIRTFRRLRSDKRGATAIEYGLIAALIVVAMMAGLNTLGGGATGLWGKLEARVAAAMT
jgi:pilus assembly protein Flp/PilA